MTGLKSKNYLLLLLKLPFTLFIFYFNTIQCQGFDKIEDLKKYSYQMVSVSMSNSASTQVKPFGTCFFIRANGQAFLITAKHNISGFNLFTLKSTTIQFDTIGIVYYNTDTKKHSVLVLPIEENRTNLTNSYFYNEPDVYIGKIELTGIEKYIYSIEKYIDSSLTFPYKVYKGIKLDSTFSYGYPEDSAGFFAAKALIYSGKVANLSILHSLNIPPQDIVYITQPSNIKGRSGSPVFHCYVSKKGHKIFKFGGVLFGHNQKYNTSFIVRSEWVLKLLKDGR